MDEKTNKPGNSDFKQQRLKGWRCAPGSLTLGSTYILMGIASIIFGVIILEETEKVVELSIRYDNIDECKASWRTPRTCILDIEVTSYMSSPVFFYYEIRNMYQNHRKYNKSRDIFQLLGEEMTKDEIETSCTPIVTMEDLGFYTELDLSQDSPANPCGLVPKSYFNDTYSLLKSESNEEIKILQDDIAWAIDIDEKFERNENWEELQWIDVENEHFIVWMSTAGTPNFRKLWGRIEEDLSKGTYRLIIINNYDVSSFDGQKRVVLSTTSAFGGDVSFMGILYIFVGCIAFLGSAIIFLTHYLKTRHS